MDTFKIVVNPDASQTVYYINGTLVATHNIVPSGTSALACGTKNTKTLGTNTKYAYMDWFKINLFRTSDR